MADIELVIKIPEETYIHLCNDESIGASLLIENAIRSGTSLPKGHGRLIDADALPLQYIDEANHGSNFIKIAPTIIEADEGE